MTKFLCRLYSPDNGKITIDGVDLTSVRGDDLRSHVAIILSDSLIFDGTIYDNIRIENLTTTRDEAIRIEGFWSFAKECLMKHHGISKEKFLYYTKEIEWRYNYRENVLFTDLTHIILGADC